MERAQSKQRSHPPSSLLSNGLRWPREISVKFSSQGNSRAVTGHQCSALDSRITTGPNRTLLDGNNHLQHDIAAQGRGHAELTRLEKASVGF